MKRKNKIHQISSHLKLLLPLDHALVSTLYTLSVKSLLTAIVFTSLITAFLYSELSYSIILWGALLITLLSFRLYFAYLFNKSPKTYSLEVWHQKFMIFAFLTGFLVSSLSFVFMPHLDEYHQLFVLASLLGLTGGATTSLSSDFRIAMTYISIIMLPLIGSLFIIKSSSSTILAILMILFFISQISMIFNNHIEQEKVKELKIQKNLLNNIFAESPLAMFSYDTNLNIQYANKHVSKIFGNNYNTMTGVNINALHNNDMLNVFQQTLTKGPQSYTGLYRDDLWVKTTAFPFKGTNDTVIGGVGIIEDKTKEYIHQKELKSLHGILQNQVEKNQSLLDENKRFIADMVHQIRTPLTVIMANASLIEMQSEEQVASYLTQINSAINMLSNAYEDLSYIISNDTIEYKPVEVDLTKFLKERIHFFKVIAQAHDKTIHANMIDNIRIMINDTELERLIDNNISNAIKHSSDRSDIKIMLEKHPSEIKLHFISEGENIRDVSMIFDKNYTESNSAKRSLGLGLNMVKTICEKNSILYSAHSENGINTFTYVFKG